jgi:hypothetical protein
VKRVQLTKTVQIPDENFEPKKKGDVAGRATNYAGAILPLGDTLADELIARGDAIEYVEPKPKEEAAAEESAAGAEGEE